MTRLFHNHSNYQRKICKIKQEALRDSEQVAKDKLRNFKDALPKKSSRALDLAAEKGASARLTVIPFKEMGFNLNKREFRDALLLRYNWPFSDIPSKCVCGEEYSVEHAIICKRGDSLYNAMINYRIWRLSF